jgi:hypothetical protein
MYAIEQKKYAHSPVLLRANNTQFLCQNASGCARLLTINITYWHYKLRFM